MLRKFNHFPTSYFYEKGKKNSGSGCLSFFQSWHLTNVSTCRRINMARRYVECYFGAAVIDWEKKKKKRERLCQQRAAFNRLSAAAAALLCKGCRCIRKHFSSPFFSTSGSIIDSARSAYTLWARLYLLVLAADFFQAHFLLYQGNRHCHRDAFLEEFWRMLSIFIWRREYRTKINKIIFYIAIYYQEKKTFVMLRDRCCRCLSGRQKGSTRA